MGIDIYAKWREQTKEEEKNQITGFSTVSGDSGYLREGYHGGPYVTKYLVSEAFGETNPAKIPASVLRERLPIAVLMALYRDKKVYGEKDPTMQDIKDLPKMLTKVFTIEVKDDTHESFARELTPDSIRYAELLIENGDLPDYAKSFVDFVVLCEQKEKLLGEPCEISASY